MNTNKYERTEEWEPLNERAREYFKLTQPLLELEGKISIEKGRDPDTGKMVGYEIDSRSEEQKELAAELVEEVFPYITKIAKNMLYGNGEYSKSHGEDRKFSVNSLSKIVEIPELANEGGMAIIKTLHKYNPSMSFSTFVHNGVVWAISRFGGNVYPGSVRIPVNLASEVRKSLSGIDGSKTKLMEDLHMTSDMADLVYYTMTGYYDSIDATAHPFLGNGQGIGSSSGTGKRTSTIGDKNLMDKSPESNVRYLLEAVLRKERIYEILTTLTEREEKVIRFRFGLGDGYPRTLDEVGSVFNITRESARRIEAKALRKLRHPTRLKELAKYVGREMVLEKETSRGYMGYTRRGHIITFKDIGSQTIERWEIANGMIA